MTRAPDLAEPVIAYRTWRALHGALVSPFLPQRWDADVVVARCERGDPARFRHAGTLLDEEHVSPDRRCRCGIHAYLEPRSALAGVDHRRVLGIVAVWGVVQVHPEGLRAQYAQIRALGASPTWSAWRHREVAEIAERLGVPMVPEASLPATASEFGSPLPAQLRRSPA